jgi:putative beta-lysine N-acetyltransferase
MINKQPDRIDFLDGSCIQHGLYNRRIYLMDLGHADPESLIPKLITMADKKGYSKIFAKIPSSKSSAFTSSGFHAEAQIPSFYKGTENAHFLSYYCDNQRCKEVETEAMDNLIRISKWQKKQRHIKPLLNGVKIRQCTADDAKNIAKIYQTVFSTYPFPVFDAEYLRQTMNNNVDYYCVELLGQLLAVSATEKDRVGENVEMTDFATLPGWLGYNFACHLLARMEQDVILDKYKLAYTIARAKSPGMNITFAKHNYAYAGRLINNTNISGNIESMNVWYKKLG